jgi:hypothetical protein
MPKGIPEFFLPVSGQSAGNFPVVWVPHLLRAAEILFSDPKKGLSGKKKVLLLDELNVAGSTFDVSGSLRFDDKGVDIFNREPPAAAAEYREVPAFARRASDYTAVRDEFVEYCYVSEGIELFHCEALDAWSQMGEAEGEFRARLSQQVRETRDASVEALRAKFAKKAAPIEERLRKAEAAIAREKDQSRGAWLQTAVSVGAGMLGALFGRKVMSGSTITRGATAARAAGRAWQQQGDVGRAAESAEAVKQQLDALETELKGEIAELEDRFDCTKTPLQGLRINPLKKNIVVTAVGVAWLPYFRVSATSLEPAWE